MTEKKDSATRQADFMAMLKQCEGIIMKVCLHFSDRSCGDLRDLYQDIVCALWQGWGRFRGESKTSTWVTQVALNTATNHLRHLRHRPPLVLMDDRYFEALADEATAPKYQQLYDLIDTLGADDRRLLYYYLDRMPMDDIAQLEHLNTETVRKRIYRIKNKLRKKAKGQL